MAVHSACRACFCLISLSAAQAQSITAQNWGILQSGEKSSLFG